MRFEIDKIIPGIEFVFNFGIMPSNPEADRIVEEKINDIANYANSLRGTLEFNEDRIEMLNYAENLTKIAQKFGFYKD